MSKYKVNLILTAVGVWYIGDITWETLRDRIEKILVEEEQS